MNYFLDARLDHLLSLAKVVIFDLNGLIVDDEGVQLEAVNLTLLKYNIQISEEYWVNQCVGHRASEFLERILHEHEIDSDEILVSDLETQKNEHYANLMKEKTRKLVRPGVLELIRFVFENPTQKLALATSASLREVDILLGELGIREKFDLIVCGDQVQRGKPHPETYRKVSTSMGIEPHDCVVFEDTSVGVESALSAGMIVIAVPNKYTRNQNFSKARFIVDNLTSTAQITL